MVKSGQHLGAGAKLLGGLTFLRPVTYYCSAIRTRAAVGTIGNTRQRCCSHSGSHIFPRLGQSVHGDHHHLQLLGIYEEGPFLSTEIIE